MSARKISMTLFILIFIVSNVSAFAQMPISAPSFMPSSGELSRIGVVAAIQGKVEVMTPGAAGRVVQSGEEIFIGDEVKTDALGHLQILLLDETVFTIGPNSAIVIDKFVYDPKTHVGNVEASIMKGVFRYVSGKIAANKPENVTIHMPTATIGIRGTIIAGEASATGSMAMLLGPGSQNDARATIGSFVMNGTGENSDQQEHVTRTGFGVSSDNTGTLSGVFQVPETQIQYLSAALLPAQKQGPMLGAGGNDQNAPQAGRTPAQGPLGMPPSGPVSRAIPGVVPSSGTPGIAPMGPVPVISGEEGGAPLTGPVTAPMTTSSFFGADENVGKVSGEQTLKGFETTQQVNTLQILQNNLNQDTTTVSQDLRNTTLQNTATSTATLTTFTEMDRATRPANFGSGLYHFIGSGILSGGPTSQNNTFSFLININFPNVDSPSDPTKSIAGGESRVEVDLAGTSLTYKLGQDVWVPGENPFLYTAVTPEETTGSNFKADIKVAIENAVAPVGNPLADVAAQANVTVHIIDTMPSTDVIIASGSAVSDQRVSGEAPPQVVSPPEVIPQ